MKVRKFISLLLLAVYLFAAGGQVYASLTCHCVALGGHAAHVCCLHCSHNDDDATAARHSMRSPCCDNHHSTNIELYISTSLGNEKAVKCIVVELPASLVAESVVSSNVPVCCFESLAERRTPFPEGTFICSAGLRAPPVLA